MPDNTVTIIVAIIAALSGGGITAAITGVFNRPKLLSEIYETRLQAMNERACQLESRLDKLEDEIKDRDNMIDSLKRENDQLKAEIKELQDENACKEKKIIKLQQQVRELKKRLDEIDKEIDG